MNTLGNTRNMYYCNPSIKSDISGMTTKITIVWNVVQDSSVDILEMIPKKISPPALGWKGAEHFQIFSNLDGYTSQGH
jgi:hypothetical protein